WRYSIEPRARPQRSASRPPATPNGFTPSCTASVTPSSWARRERFGPWWSGRRKPIGAMLGTFSIYSSTIAFPTVWMPDPETRDLRALVAHRVRLVRMRTMDKNGLQAIALNPRLGLRSGRVTQRGLSQLRALALQPHTQRRRDDSLA